MSDLDRIVAEKFTEIVDNSKITTGRSSPAIYRDSDLQLGALSILESDMGKDPFQRVSLEAMEAVRNLVDKADKLDIIPEIERRANTDQLTGLQNRHSANLLMNNAAEHLRRGDYMDGGIGFIIFDANDFKRINDTLGHDVGDSVLKVIAEILRKHTRSADVTARWGGEEFLVAMPGDNLDEETMINNWGPEFLENGEISNFGKVFAQIHDELIEKLTKLNPDYFSDKPEGFVPGSLSYGWSFLSTNDCRNLGNPNAEVLVQKGIREADECLYNNKKKIKGVLPKENKI